MGEDFRAQIWRGEGHNEFLTDEDFAKMKDLVEDEGLEIEYSDKDVLQWVEHRGGGATFEEVMEAFVKLSGVKNKEPIKYELWLLEREPDIEDEVPAFEEPGAQ